MNATATATIITDAAPLSFTINGIVYIAESEVENRIKALQTAAQPPETMSVKDACTFLGISRYTFEKYANSGLLTKQQAAKRGKILVSKTEVDAVLKLRADNGGRMPYGILGR